MRCSKCGKTCGTDWAYYVEPHEDQSVVVPIVSDCCGSEIIYEGPEIDETETPGGHLPYGGGEC